MSVKQSQKFNKEHRLNCSEPVSYGYKDGGRGLKFDDNGEILKHGGREIIVVKSPAEDPSLQKALDTAIKKTAKMNSIEQKARFLNKFVDQLLPQNDARKNLSILAQNLEGDYKGKDISLGQLIDAGTGVCRHRSLLFKVLGDEVGVPSALVRGHYNDGVAAGGHAWNEVRLEDGQCLLVDVMNDIIEPLDSANLAPFKDIHKNDMYAKMTPPSNTVGHHKWDTIQKSGQDGIEVCIQDWSDSKKSHLLSDLKNMGVAAEVKISTAQGNQPVIRIIGDIDTAVIETQIAQEQRRNTQSAPITDLIAADWLDVTNRQGEAAKYLDTNALSDACLVNLQRTLYSEGISYETKNSSANGGMRVLAISGDNLTALNKLQENATQNKTPVGLNQQSANLNKMHIPATPPAQSAQTNTPKISKRLQSKVAGFFNKVRPIAAKPKI